VEGGRAEAKKLEERTTEGKKTESRVESED
jgi:hypothetical protein